MIVLKIHMKQFVEEMNENGLFKALCKTIGKYFSYNRVVVPTFKNLSSVQAPSEPNTTEKLEFLVVNKENVEKIVSMYGVGSRRLKATHNVVLGYTAFVVALDGEIVADVWCATPHDIGSRDVHTDLKWLDINCGERDAYMFDMYVRPDKRGTNLSNYLFGKALVSLKEMGYSTVFGYYENQNIPALWAHRVAGYTEMKKRKIRQAFFYRT